MPWIHPVRSSWRDRDRDKDKDKDKDSEVSGIGVLRLRYPKTGSISAPATVRVIESKIFNF